MTNSITFLLTIGTWYDSLFLICNAVKKYFYDLFNKPQIPRMTLNWNLLFPNKIPQPQDLESPFLEEEIKRNALSLPGDKSLGSDAFTLCFYHH